MSDPLVPDFTPIGIGTAVFAISGIVLCGAGQFIYIQDKKSNSPNPRLTKGEANLCAFFVMVTIICMWMMWTMTWLSQVNPILYPIGENHENHE
eukprot:CAMPEP_0184542160 /NCGR_PEP_ID=MMETSP0199_2-20130426/1820_1 /TAXON_ID=1112570 /ORGANISM="Thraustochytrium sp., Strain LLF1b" /LENGTH=93 /DNA_ID=CAMNT_0026935927 /DNA_START=178 /DNA_END=459 /DNA_ORIENTATION=-